MYAVDQYLEKSKGVVDDAKAMTKEERENASRALLKGQKKAIKAHATVANAIDEKKTGFTQAREHARDAARAAGKRGEDDGVGGGGGGIRDGAGKNTAVL